MLLYRLWEWVIHLDLAARSNSKELHTLEIYPMQTNLVQLIMGGSGKSSSTNNRVSIHSGSCLDRAQSLSFSKFRHVCACVLYPTTAESSALHCHTFTDMSALHLHKPVLSITSL